MDMNWPFAGVPIGHGNEVAVLVAWRAGGRFEKGLVGLAGADGGLNGIVDGEDRVLGAIGAVGGFVLSFHDKEGVKYIGCVVTSDSVQVKEGGIQFTANLKPAIFIPLEWRTVITAVFSKWR